MHKPLPNYHQYYALNENELRCLVANNWWRAYYGKPIIEVPEHDYEYHRLFKMPNPETMLDGGIKYLKLLKQRNMETVTETSKRSLIELTQSQLELIATLEETGGELTDEIESQLAINKEQLNEKICTYQKVMQSLHGKVFVADMEMERLDTFRSRCMKAIDRLKDNMLTALETFGEQDLKGVYRLEAVTDENIVSLSSRKSSSVSITNLDELPADYWRVPELKAAPDKAAIKKALDAGTAVPGAEIVESLNLVIK